MSNRARWTTDAIRELIGKNPNWQTLGQCFLLRRTSGENAERNRKR